MHLGITKNSFPTLIVMAMGKQPGCLTLRVSRNFRHVFRVDASQVSRAKRTWRNLGQRRARGHARL